MTRLPLLTVALVFAGGGAFAQTPTPASGSSGHYTGEKLATLARVSIQTAEATALSARPGVVADRELEKEGGGSGLRYSFDIKSAGMTYEVGVDAKTGKVLENAKEGAHPD